MCSPGVWLILQKGRFFGKSWIKQETATRKRPMTTITQITELLKNLFQLLADQRQVAGQQQVYERVEMLVLAELFTFGVRR